MRLVPKNPPGRCTRKARVYESEIRQLRQQGYTFEEIRAALADAGVHVSRSTVQREAARHALDATTNAADSVPRRARAPTSTPAPAAPTTAPARTGVRSGKDIAEAFVLNRITNPLIRNRSRDEDRRH